MSQVYCERVNSNKEKNGVEMMVNINRNYEKRTCYFEAAFSLGDACGNHKLCGH